MRSVMLDIETLSTKNDACVISIGLAAFNDNEVLATEGAIISPNYWHGHIDPQTVKWWLQQSDDARAAICKGEVPDLVAGARVRDFLKHYGGDELWANDPTFDCVILKNWWSRVGGLGVFPSHYREERSCRTLFAEARRHNIDLQSAWFNGVAHDAVSDAACQARAVILARRELFGKRYCPHGLLVGSQCLECKPVNGVVSL